MPNPTRVGNQPIGFTNKELLSIFSAIVPGKHDLGGAAALYEQARLVPQGAGVVFAGAGADFVGVGRQFVVQPLEVDAGVAGTQLIERHHRLGEQIDRGLAPAARKAQMQSGGDSMQGADHLLERFGSVVTSRLELLAGREVIAAIEGGDRLLEGRRHSRGRICRFARHLTSQ